MAVLAIGASAGLWLGLADDGNENSIEVVDEANDPYRDVASDDRAPTIAVSLVSDDNAQFAQVDLDPVGRRVPDRQPIAFLQAEVDGSWSTTHTLSAGAPLNYDGDRILEGIAPSMSDRLTQVGPGPDFYHLPTLASDVAYRLCIEFHDVGRPPTDAMGCSEPFFSA